MCYGESDAIVLHAVTYALDSDGGEPGEEIDLTGRMNAVVDGRRTLNTNVALACGVIVRVTNRGRMSQARRGQDGLLYVDTVAVLIDLNEARARLTRGVEFCAGRHGLEYAARLLAATKAAVVANAERSWPRMRYLSVTVVGGQPSENRTEVGAVPRRKLAPSY